MTLVLIILLLTQVALVAGQIFLKHGMNRMDHVPRPTRSIVINIAAGIALLTVWFLLWMGLLQKFDLSFVYPFEGVSVVLLVLTACITLRERLSLRSWLGVAMITLGVILVGISQR
jgi:uncharacterized membrane protein